MEDARDQDPASYYGDLTRQYEIYGGRTHGWHYGVWEPDVTGHEQSLLRSNELLLGGLQPGRETRILDVGFGSGGFAVWAAERFGCRMTGITICPDHVEHANRLAASRGVAERCSFRLMDMDDMSFPDGVFDVVTNQDTYCHAAGKTDYLQSVRRILRPGGSWRAIDFSVQPGPLEGDEAKAYQEVCEGFHIPSMVPEPVVRTLLEGLGFEAVETADLTPQVERTAAIIIRQCYLPLLAAKLGLDWLIYSRDAERRRNRRGHITAAWAYSHGLKRRYFRHNYYSARRPG